MVSKHNKYGNSALAHLPVNIHTLENSLHLESLQSKNLETSFSSTQLKLQENKDTRLNHMLPIFDSFLTYEKIKIVH